MLINRKKEISQNELSEILRGRPGIVLQLSDPLTRGCYNSCLCVLQTQAFPTLCFLGEEKQKTGVRSYILPYILSFILVSV